MKTSPARRLSLLHGLVTLLESGIAPRRAYEMVTAEASDKDWLQADPVTVCLLAGGRHDAAPDTSLRLAVWRLRAEALLFDRIRRVTSRVGTLVALAGVVFVLGLVVVVPEFRSIYNSMNVELPAATKVLLHLSAVIEDAGLVLTFMAGALALCGARRLGMRLAPHLPLAGRVVRLWNGARLRRDLGTLIVAGVSPMRALDALARSARAERDHGRAAALASASGFIMRGETLSGALARARCEPALIALVNSGEDAGTLDRFLLSAAYLAERALLDTVCRASKWAVPLAMFSLAIAAGLTGVAFFSPMLKLMNCVC